MFTPQWQIKTPIRGTSKSGTSRSSGSGFTTISLPRTSQMTEAASHAAPDACVTVSGMSLGDSAAPLT